MPRRDAGWIAQPPLSLAGPLGASPAPLFAAASERGRAPASGALGSAGHSVVHAAPHVFPQKHPVRSSYFAAPFGCAVSHLSRQDVSVGAHALAQDQIALHSPFPAHARATSKQPPPTDAASSQHFPHAVPGAGGAVGGAAR